MKPRLMQPIVWSMSLVLAAAGGFVLGSLNGAADPREQLLEADREFDRAVAERGLEAWVDHFAEDGRMLPVGADPVIGREAIRKQMAPAFATAGFSIRWRPVFADIARSGDLGYTYGTSEVRSAGKDGTPVTQYGKYLTVWKKQANRSWRVAADIGNSRPSQQAASQ